MMPPPCSGAVAQGLSAINTYIGSEQDPADYARMVSNDLMGITRDDLAYDVGRNVDDSVHLFEEWGLPIMKDPKTGRYLREGRWQIMIHGESYKPIVAEAAKKSADKVFNRICVTHLLMDESKENRVGGAVGFNVRTGDFHVFRAKAVIVAAGAVLSVQAAINGRLGESVGVLRSSLLTFFVGAVITGLLIVFFEPAHTLSLLDVPKWQVCGALFGVVYMMVMVGAVPVVGTAVATVAVIVGQLGMGMLIDNFGWLGNPAIELSSSRILAMVCLGLALVFMYRSSRQAG